MSVSNQPSLFSSSQIDPQGNVSHGPNQFVRGPPTGPTMSPMGHMPPGPHGGPHGPHPGSLSPFGMPNNQPGLPQVTLRFCEDD